MVMLNCININPYNKIINIYLISFSVELQHTLLKVRQANVYKSLAHTCSLRFRSTLRR